MNLVIGSSSQLAQYFPDDYIKVSSRNIDLDYLAGERWESVYITFAEQRIYDTGIDYITPNYIYTLELIKTLIDKCDKIVCYTSCELWNELSGNIALNTPAKFYPITNEYCISKLLLWNKILELRKVDERYMKVIFIHPFYFNSVYRNEYFLFGKIFKSIIERKKVKVGNLDFCRDMVHTSFVVKKSIKAKNDIMCGSGKLFNARNFIKDLYGMNGMDFDYFVEEDVSVVGGKSKEITADVGWDYGYEDLVRDTQEDILNSIGGKSGR